MEHTETWRADLLSTAHALIAGTTGSGKSVALNSMMAWAMKYHPENYYMFIDLKRVELALYRDLPGCMGYATTEEEATALLKRASSIMESRYGRMTGRRTSDPPIYIVIDELAGLADNRPFLKELIHIGRLGRAAEIHIIAATQDPSRRTLKAQIMQNFSMTIALRCRSAIESRQIVGVSGAECLPRYGKGLAWDYRGVMDMDVVLTPDNILEDLVSLRIQKADERRRSNSVWGRLKSLLSA